MRILLVEDRIHNVDNYRYAIHDYHKDIEIIAAQSFEDLEHKLLTRDFDSAIIDMDLSKWQRGYDKDITTGKDICDHLVKTKNYEDIKSSVFLYTAQELKEFPVDAAYTVVEKIREQNAIEKFQSSILEIMKDKEAIEPPVSLNEFRDYTEPEKIQHYKHLISKDKGYTRFEKHKENMLWASDIGVEAKKSEMVCFLPPSRNEFVSEVGSQYQELDDLIEEENKLPSIFWNYSEPQLLKEQKAGIRNTDLKNSFINLFFRVSFGQCIGNYLLEKDSGIRSDLLKLIDPSDTVMLRETHCQVIDTMAKSDEKASVIRKELQGISRQTGYEVVEYFQASLDSFDVDTDTAQVDLTSKIDPGKHFKKEFSYERLSANGVRFKEDDFIFCVSQHGGSVSSYVEPF